MREEIYKIIREITDHELTVKETYSIVNEILKLKNMNNNNDLVKINTDDFDEHASLTCKWYVCPSCKDKHVKYKDNFCSECGCRFKWE